MSAFEVVLRRPGSEERDVAWMLAFVKGCIRMRCLNLYRRRESERLALDAWGRRSSAARVDPGLEAVDLAMFLALVGDTDGELLCMAVAGFTEAEMAVRFGVSVQTLKSRLRRARLRARQLAEASD